MKLWKGKSRELSAGQARLAERLAERILLLQAQAASWLNGKTSGISFRCWRVMLVLFCLAFGGYCCWLVWDAFLINRIVNHKF